MQNPQSGPSYPLASLYVGDLHPDVTEAMLFEKFSTAGQVLSIRVCRDMMTRRSLGYAYVNFQLAQDAERAMDSMNYDSMKGRPVRIMWSQRDPSLRRSGFGNIFIKNLDKQIDNKSMYDTFSGFGAILSCKVAQDETGASRGYAFVHFELESSAVQAIEKVNGMLLNGKKVFVGRFVPRAERDKAYGDSPRKFTNVFVKNFGDNMDEDKLKALFEKFGTISSLRVMTDESTGKSKGFGFVSFETAEAAEEAVNALNGTDIGNGTILFVGRAQKRAERQQELRRQFDLKRQERQSRFAGVNLYVKNLDENIDDETLKKEFSHIGQISSAKIMRDGTRSKGFGFVCFNTPEEASKAVDAMNGKVLGTKPLYVAMAQRKDERRNNMAHQLMSRFVPNQFQPRGPMPGQMAFPPGAMQGQMAPPYLYPANMAQAQRGYFPAAVPQQMGPMQPMQGMMRAPQRWNNQGQYAPRGGQPGAPYQQQMQQQGMQGGGQQFRPQGGPRSMRPPGAMGGPRGGMPPGVGGVPPGMTGQQGIPQQQQGPNAAQQQGSPRPQQNGMNGPVQGGTRTGAPAFIRPAGQAMPRGAAPNTQHAPQSGNVSGIDPAVLAKAPSHEQKQILGEKLFPLISQTYPELAGKVTGMLLEIDNSELLLMLEQPEQLKGKVDEAVTVLKSHLGGAPGASTTTKAGGDATKQDGAK